MSPELLGWHEQQGLDTTPVMSASPHCDSPHGEPEQPPPSFQFMRAPTSAVKSKHAAESSAMGKAVRVKTPAKYVVDTYSECEMCNLLKMCATDIYCLVTLLHGL